MICPACSTNNRPRAKFCCKCGTPFPVETEEPITSIPQVPSAKSEFVPEPLFPVNTDYIGLQEIRTRVEMYISTLLIRQKQKKIGMPVQNSNHILVFSGETGTGKSLVAEWFINELKKSECLCSPRIERTTAHKFQRLYPSDIEISKYLSEQSLGVLLIDEIHNDTIYLHELLLGLSEKKNETIFILIGIKEGIEKFFEEKNELTDLVEFYNFPTVNDDDLTKILKKKLIDNGFTIDDNIEDALLPCVQEARNDEKCVYKNGWIVEKYIIQKIFEKQANRLGKMETVSPQDLKYIKREDLPVTQKVQSVTEVLSMLDDLVGMESVKTAIRSLCQTILNNQQRSKMGIKVENPKIHIVLTGNPGTGKTTVARILGKLFYAMKLLPSDKVLETSGLDLTAGYVGQTKDKVNSICDKAMGGVLFIDEAYYLAGTEGNTNAYGSEAVGTLLKRMEDDRGKFVIIAAGYQNEMQNFLRMNPGLDSRFEHKIHINDYSADELFKILLLYVKNAQFTLKEDAEKTAKTAIDDLCRNKGKDFTNARAVRNLFDMIKAKMDSRIASISSQTLTQELLTTIKKEDIPYDENTNLTPEKVFAELNELIGMEKVKSTVRELYNTIQINREMEIIGRKQKNPEIHIALTGNPGTGKTTVARILGKLFYSIGLLPSKKVIECDRSKIVAKYVGHTAQNMQRLCDDAMGGILFIDEVYTLATDDFGHEATDTLMKRMEDDRGKFIVIVAGYEGKMNEWMQTNDGLASRFTHHIHIDDYNSEELYQLFCLFSKNEGLLFSENADKCCHLIINKIWENRGSDFANGRTIRKLFDTVVRKKNSRIIDLSKAERTQEVLTTLVESDFDFGGDELYV